MEKKKKKKKKKKGHYCQSALKFLSTGKVSRN
jgi:hypothetical protein